MHIKRILIIDDSPVARILLKKCIGEGFEVFEAESGDEGLDLYKSINADVTFLDLTMPGMNGLDVLRELRIINPDARVIVVSADRQISTIREAVSIGAYTMLKKPPRQEIIQKTLHSIEIGEKTTVEGL